jgi:hypothetical protein
MRRLVAWWKEWRRRRRFERQRRRAQSRVRDGWRFDIAAGVDPHEARFWAFTRLYDELRREEAFRGR